MSLKPLPKDVVRRSLASTSGFLVAIAPPIFGSSHGSLSIYLTLPLRLTDVCRHLIAVGIVGLFDNINLALLRPSRSRRDRLESWPTATSFGLRFVSKDSLDR